MFKLYGDTTFLPNNIKNKLNYFIEHNTNINFDLFVYKSYPCEIVDDVQCFLKLLLVSKKGIYYLNSENGDKKIYRKYVQQLCLDIPSIADKLDKNIKIYQCIDEGFDLNEILISNDVLSDDEVILYNAKFQSSNCLSEKDDRLCRPKSIGERIKERNNTINLYDNTQFNTIYSREFCNHKRIRGLAGSGKTIVLVKRMAFLHYINKNYDLCYVFYTVSLKQYIKNLFIKFYKEISGNDSFDESKVHFLHGWGSFEMNGFYFNVCSKIGQKTQGLHNEKGECVSFDSVCKELLLNIKNNKLGFYDFVFIDEAQDFPASFFKLALKTLKTEGKILYAYDELQSLYNENVMPTKSDIFNNETCDDINLSVCYRTPKEILITAHALGMGIYSDNKNICNIPQDLDIWQAIGYKSNGELNYGTNVVLYREPSTVDFNCSDLDLITFKTFESKKTQYEYLCECIYNLIKKDDISTNDILIIDLDNFDFESNFELFKKINTAKLNQFSSGKERLYELNLINKDNRLRLRSDGFIPYTTIFRAKGNEANIVFVVNADKLASLLSFNRNRLFTAMTRAKFEVYIFGNNGINHYIEEYQKVKEHGYTLNFKYPTIPELKRMKTIAAEDQRKNNEAIKIVELSKTIKDKKLMLDIILSQTNCKTFDELKEFFRNEKKE